MTDLYKAFLVAGAMAFAMPVAAQAPGPTTAAFDGTYAGVSNQMSNALTTGRSCPFPPPNPVPPALTIANGVVQTKTLGGMDGSVNAQGAIVMHTSGENLKNARFDAQIDGQGTVRGQLAGSLCYWRVVWQKQK